jgi:hypothetical protein
MIIIHYKPKQGQNAPGRFPTCPERRIHRRRTEALTCRAVIGQPSAIAHLRKTPSFLNLSYVCPEPVLVKLSFLYGSTKGRFSHRVSKLDHCAHRRHVREAAIRLQKNFPPQYFQCLSQACLGKLIV